MKKRGNTKTRLEKISSYLLRLENDKNLLSKRVFVMKELLIIYQGNYSKTSSEEEKQIFIEAYDAFQSLAQTGTDFLTELDTEIERVRRAITGLEKTNIEDIQNAFEEFILTDMAFTIKNIGMELYDLDETIKSLERFNNMPSGGQS